MRDRCASWQREHDPPRKPRFPVYNDAVSGPGSSRRTRSRTSAATGRVPACHPRKEGFVNALLSLSRAIDAINERVGKTIDLADPGRRRDQRRQRGRALRSERQFERVARDPVVPVLGGVPALAGYMLQAQRAHPHRRRRRPPVGARAELDRRLRHRLLPAADGDPHPVAVVAGVHDAWSATRCRQRRRPRALAGAAAGADRLLPADAAGHFRAHQAHRLPAEGPDPLDKAGTDRRGTAGEEIRAPRSRRGRPRGTHGAGHGPQGEQT